MIRRMLHGVLWVKIVPVFLIFVVGVSEKNASLTVFGIVLILGSHELRAGIREQYWVPEHLQNEWHWTDLVWSHATWINRVVGDPLPESPDAGVERLAGPHRVPQTYDTKAPNAPHLLKVR